MLIKHFVWLICLSYLLGLSTNTIAQESNTDEIKAKYNQARHEFEMYEHLHGNFLRTRNINMHYLTWGNSEDEPIIWIHGSFTNAYEIKEVADRIAQEGYYLIAIDYYGHGLTPIPDHEVSLYHIADDILDLMDHKKIDKAVIGGWSRGAYIATAFYDAYPDRVKGLILEDGGTVAFNTFFHTLDDEELTGFVNDLFTDPMEYSKFDSEYEVYKAYQDPTDNSTQFELLAWISQDKECRWTIGPGIKELFHMANANQFINNIKRPNSAPLFARSIALIEPFIIFRNLNVPLLILDPVSESDLFPFEKENDRLQKLHPHLITHNIYENTGHNIHYEIPEKFVEDIIMFLK